MHCRPSGPKYSLECLSVSVCVYLSQPCCVNVLNKQFSHKSRYRLLWSSQYVLSSSCHSPCLADLIVQLPQESFFFTGAAMLLCSSRYSDIYFFTFLSRGILLTFQTRTEEIFGIISLLGSGVKIVRQGDLQM